MPFCPSNVLGVLSCANRGSGQGGYGMASIEANLLTPMSRPFGNLSCVGINKVCSLFAES